MRAHSFYRFDIKRQGGTYRLRLGWKGEAKRDYGDLEHTHFARLMPDTGKRHESYSGAQNALCALIQFLNAHAIYGKMR